MRHDLLITRSVLPHRRAASAFRRAFTLMELMVAVSILVIIILSIGITFSSASKSVGVSQATMDLMANVRATQQLLARDVAGLNKNGFLAIRCRAYNTSSDSAVENSLRFDQFCFMSYGNFPDRTGTTKQDSTFSNNASANAALCWWGQLLMEKQGANINSSTPGPAQSFIPPNESFLAGGTQSDFNNWQSNLPTGAYMVGNTNQVVPNADGTVADKNFYLGRHAFLLMPGAFNNNVLAVPGGNPVPAFQNPALVAGNSIPSGVGYDNAAADPASSRYDVVAMAPSQVMSWIETQNALSGATIDNCAEALGLTYRFRALASVYDTDASVNQFANGYFRSTPIVMQGVSSFKVEWTDGTSYTDTNNDPFLRANPSLFSQIRWFGPTHASGSLDGTVSNLSLEKKYYPSNSNAVTRDQYIAVFNYSNRPNWPKALRITMHIGSDRLQGGRDFVQIIKLPD